MVSWPVVVAKAWRQVGPPQTVSLPTNALAGLAVCAHTPKDVAEAVMASATLSVADSDLDGLPDAWEIARFGNLTTANPASDFDGDGFTDAQEGSCGLDPTVVDLLEITDVTVGIGGSVLLVGFYGVPVVDYPLESTTFAPAAVWTEVIGVGRTTDPGEWREGLIRNRYACQFHPVLLPFLYGSTLVADDSSQHECTVPQVSGVVLPDVRLAADSKCMPITNPAG